MQVKEVMKVLNTWTPLYYAEEWDNVGLLCGDRASEVSGILVTHDVTPEILEEAENSACNMVVCFHPILFTPLKSLEPRDHVSDILVKAIKKDIAIYAIHTALDNAWHGVSMEMAKQFDIKTPRILIPRKNVLKKLTTYVPQENLESLRTSLFAVGAGQIGNYSNCSFTSQGTGTFMGNEESNPVSGKRGQLLAKAEIMLSLVFPAHRQQELIHSLHKNHPYEEVAYEITALENAYQKIGMGAIGELNEELDIQQFLKRVQRVFKMKMLRFNSPVKKNGLIKTVAFLGGSGSFAIEPAFCAGADALITGDLKYHDFFRRKGNMIICDIGHYESERFTNQIIYEFLAEKFTNFAVLHSKIETNPVNYYKTHGKKEDRER